jgi:hypothetical protein
MAHENIHTGSIGTQREIIWRNAVNVRFFSKTTFAPNRVMTGLQQPKISRTKDYAP